MPIVNLPGGGTAIVCTRGRRPACSVCGKRPGELLCDGPGAEPGKTCDARLCRSCAQHVAPDTDLCPRHRRAA
jgi:hypothetical protein